MGGGGGGRDLIQKETFHRPCSVPVEGMRTHANAHTHTHTHTHAHAQWCGTIGGIRLDIRVPRVGRCCGAKIDTNDGG